MKNPNSYVQAFYRSMMSTCSNKRQKLTTYVNKDRISELPDHILHLILGNLESTSVVKTSILSTRWRYVWKKLHILKFCYEDSFLNIEDEEYQTKKMEYYVKTVGETLHCRDPSTNIDSIEYIIPNYIPENHVDSEVLSSIFEYGFSHKIKSLRFKFISKRGWSTIASENVDLSKYLSRSKSISRSLTSLELSSFGKIMMPTSFSLPSLRVLHLRFFKFKEHHKNTFSELRNLQTLTLMNCVIFTKTMKELNFCFKKLNYLNIDYNQRMKKDEYLSECKIRICAPKLTKFVLKGPILEIFSFGNIGRLRVLHIKSDPHLLEDQNKRLYAERMIKMLRRLSKAKEVSIFLKTLEDLSSVPDLLVDPHPRFVNLKKLTLLICDENCKEITHDIQNVLNYLLKNSSDVKIVEEDYMFK